MCNEKGCGLIFVLFVAEQKEIAEEKAGAPLSWEDTRKMKFTWRVCQETLRLQPPVQAAFRKAIQDFEYEGYTIPKGWTVSFLTFFSNIIFYHLLILVLATNTIHIHFEIKLTYASWRFDSRISICYSLGPLNNLGELKNVMFISHGVAILCLSTPQGPVTLG